MHMYSLFKVLPIASSQPQQTFLESQRFSYKCQPSPTLKWLCPTPTQVIKQLYRNSEETKHGKKQYVVFTN